LSSTVISGRIKRETDEEAAMISRVWHGWTTPQNADAYEKLLHTQIFPGILARKAAGFRKIELFRRTAGAEVEFITVMWFDTLDAVKAFAGEDYETAVVPPAARAVLARFDARSQHYEVREQRNAEG
jgi:antibiotic biosynthesis monooxygenase (ABM) superfamily enzyme